ncbi:MAG: hypothetical protein ABIG69_01925 [Bacteroidota bacterium]
MNLIETILKRELVKSWDREFRNESIEFYLNDPQNTKKVDLETIILIQLK